MQHFFLKIEYFEDTSNLKENLNSSFEMLLFFPAKSVGTRFFSKIFYVERKLAEICDAAKGET